MRTLVVVSFVAMMTFLYLQIREGNKANKRASEGITLIEKSKLDSIQKLQLLTQWTSPYVSQDRFNALKMAIREAERQNIIDAKKGNKSKVTKK